MSQLLFENARVFTMDPGQPRAEAVAVKGHRIAGGGNAREAAGALNGMFERVDCGGGDLMPAFIDAHCHLLAYAASLRSMDCTASRSISEIQDAVRQRAAEIPAGSWLRATGYEETALAERRHPTRHDLDPASPGHPVRLIHRSGHASVLNTRALELLGFSTETEEPPGGAMERDLETGEPNGVFLGMEHLFDGLVPPPPYEELEQGVREAGNRLLAAGVTCIQDATHTNGRDAWDLVEALIEDGALQIDVVMMEGIEHFGELPEAAAGGRLRRGAVKIMLHELGDGMSPSEGGLREQVWAAHEAGRQVAIHAVGERAVAAAASAIEDALRRTPRTDHRHRIEHCSQLPEGSAVVLADLGIFVVSQPSLVYERGDRYLQLLPGGALDHAYAFRTLRDAGVALAAGSDAPVTPPEPLASVAAAAGRVTAGGGLLGPSQAVTAEEALSWWTAGSAHAAFLEGELGAIRPGLRADLVLLPPGSLERSSAELRSVTPERVWRAGSELNLSAR
jgi:predicted amidohydrolase YtcJ